MYRIVKDGAELALIEAPSYVRKAENGCFVLCQEAEATGSPITAPCTTCWAGRNWRERRA